MAIEPQQIASTCLEGDTSMISRSSLSRSALGCTKGSAEMTTDDEKDYASSLGREGLSKQPKAVAPPH